MFKSIYAMYFSPTGTTQKVVTGIAEGISNQISDDTANNTGREIMLNQIDFTLPEARSTEAAFAKDDVVVFGVPVYAGRVPNVLLNYLKTIKGNSALAIPVVVYGNRNYDDALIELCDILEGNNFKVIAGGAFIGEHSFSKILAKNRPNEKDMNIIGEFARQIYAKITSPEGSKPVSVKGNRPYRKYYMPKNKDGVAVDIRKVAPKTNSECTNCKLCVKVCPMGSIDGEDTSRINGICIKCGACLKKCPVQAKYYEDKDYLRHQYELEAEYASRREPEYFI